MSEECAICLENINNSTIYKTLCEHKFHLSCIKQLHNSKCPLCNKILPLDIELLDLKNTSKLLFSTIYELVNNRGNLFNFFIICKKLYLLMGSDFIEYNVIYDYIFMFEIFHTIVSFYFFSLSYIKILLLIRLYYLTNSCLALNICFYKIIYIIININNLFNDNFIFFKVCQNIILIYLLIFTRNKIILELYKSGLDFCIRVYQ